MNKAIFKQITMKTVFESSLILFVVKRQNTSKLPLRLNTVVSQQLSVKFTYFAHGGTKLLFQYMTALRFVYLLL